MSWNILKKAITDVIKTNGAEEITGQLLQDTLVSMVNALGENATFAGFAHPNTMPGTPDGPVFFFATEPGTYANFGGIEVRENETAVLLNRYSQWEKHTLSLGGGSSMVKDLGGIGDDAFTYLANLDNLVTKTGDGAYIFDKPILYSWYSGRSANLAISLASPSVITQFHFGYAGSVKVRYVQWSVSQGVVQQVTAWNDYAVTSGRAGFMTPNMLKILEGASGVMGGNAQVIEWSHTHNMNDYKEAGTYRIKGERTGNPLSDNLPIMNQGSGHTIEGILYVLDSSLTNGSGNSDDCTITQFLMLSNRVGGQEGDMYMRSAYGANKDSLTWKSWEKYQTNMEVGVVGDDATHDATTLAPINSNGLKTFVDNGIYSGVYLTQEALEGDKEKAETFVMVVINNYVTADANKTITQIKFAVATNGTYSQEYRTLGSDGSWSDWHNGMAAVTIVNDLTTGGADKALSAEMGKTLGVDTENEIHNRLLYTEGVVEYDVNLPGGKPYKKHNILLKGGQLYQLTFAIDSAMETNVYNTVHNITDDSQVATSTIYSGVINVNKTIYVKEDCYIQSYAAVTEKTLHITARTSLAKTQLIQKLSSAKTNNRFVTTIGGVASTPKNLGIYEVVVNGISNIHVYEENIDGGNLAIAFYDENSSFIESGKLAAINTEGYFAWFFSEVPNNAVTAKITAFYGNGEPIIGTLDNRAKSSLEKEIERIQEEKVPKDGLEDKIIGGKLIYSNEFTDRSTSYNGKRIDVSSYANGTQFLFRIHSANINSSNKTVTLRCFNNYDSREITFVSEGDFWIEKTEPLTEISVYVAVPVSGETNSLSYSLTAMTVAKMLHRQENAYVKVPSLDVGTNWQNGYFTNLYPPTKISTREWLTLPIQYSNGFKIHVNADFTTYVVVLKYFVNNSPAGAVYEYSYTTAFDYDLSDVTAWTLQMRRIDRAYLDPAVGNEAVTIELIDGEVYEKPQTKREVVELLTNSSELESIVANKTNTIQESLSSLKKQTIDSVNFPMPSPNLYGHLFIEKIHLSSKPSIPCQSVFDVAVTARMGFKMIEANVLITADGIPVTGHQTSVDGVNGYLQTLQDLNGNPVSVKIADITFEELRTNYRYKSKYAQYRTPITSLEEFLLACKRFNITPFVQIVNADIVKPIVESIVGKSYVAYGGSRAKTDVTIYAYLKGTIDELLAQCDNIGAPFILGVNANSLDGFTDEEVKTLVEGIHNRGCRIGWAGSYHSQKNNMRYHELGLDISASGWDVPDFTEADEVNAFGNEIRGFKDFGKDQTGVLTLLSGESLSVPAEQKSIISKASLHIHYKGELKFNFGHHTVVAEPLTSDGLKEMVITSVIDDEAPSLNITATGDTEIYSISYKVASVV